MTNLQSPAGSDNKVNSHSNNASSNHSDTLSNKSSSSISMSEKTADALSKVRDHRTDKDVRGSYSMKERKIDGIAVMALKSSVEDGRLALEEKKERDVSVEEKDEKSETKQNEENEAREIKEEERKFNMFLDWMKQHGAKFPHLEVRRYAKDYRGVHVTLPNSKSSVQKGKILLRIPLKLLITVEKAKESAIGTFLSASSLSSLGSQALLALYLLQEKKKGKESFWYQWMNVLPASFSTLPMFFTDREWQMLKNCHELVQKVKNQQKSMREEYSAIIKLKGIDSLFPVSPASSNSAPFSYDEFVWSCLAVGTRVFSLNINGTKTSVLAPLADMMNHKNPAGTNWSFCNKKGSFLLTACQGFASGDAVFESYGVKDNKRFFASYGFCLEDNPANEVSVLIRQDALSHEQSESQAPTPTPSANSSSSANGLGGVYRTFTVRAAYDSMTEELLSFLRVSNAYDYQLDENERSRNTSAALSAFPSSITSANLTGPLSVDNELSALYALRCACKEHLRAFDNSLEDDVRVLASPAFVSITSSNLNARNCLVFRIGEKKIYKFFVDFSSLAISILCVPWEEAKVKIRQVLDPANTDSALIAALMPYVSDVLAPLLQEQHAIMMRKKKLGTNGVLRRDEQMSFPRISSASWSGRARERERERQRARMTALAHLGMMNVMSDGVESGSGVFPYTDDNGDANGEFSEQDRVAGSLMYDSNFAYQDGAVGGAAMAEMLGAYHDDGLYTAEDDDEEQPADEDDAPHERADHECEEEGDADIDADGDIDNEADEDDADVSSLYREPDTSHLASEMPHEGEDDLNGVVYQRQQQSNIHSRRRSQDAQESEDNHVSSGVGDHHSRRRSRGDSMGSAGSAANETSPLPPISRSGRQKSHAVRRLPPTHPSAQSPIVATPRSASRASAERSNSALPSVSPPPPPSAGNVRTLSFAVNRGTLEREKTASPAKLPTVFQANARPNGTAQSPPFTPNPQHPHLHAHSAVTYSNTSLANAEYSAAHHSVNNLASMLMHTNTNPSALSTTNASATAVNNTRNPSRHSTHGLTTNGTALSSSYSVLLQQSEKQERIIGKYGRLAANSYQNSANGAANSSAQYSTGHVHAHAAYPHPPNNLSMSSAHTTNSNTLTSTFSHTHAASGHGNVHVHHHHLPQSIHCVTNPLVQTDSTVAPIKYRRRIVNEPDAAAAHKTSAATLQPTVLSVSTSQDAALSSSVSAPPAASSSAALSSFALSGDCSHDAHAAAAHYEELPASNYCTVSSSA